MCVIGKSERLTRALTYIDAEAFPPFMVGQNPFDDVLFKGTESVTEFLVADAFALDVKGY